MAPNFSCLVSEAVKAVDALMDSQWAKESKGAEEPLFTCREDVVDFLGRLGKILISSLSYVFMKFDYPFCIFRMLIHKFFHRAKKVTVSEQELKGKRKKKEEKKDDFDEKEEKPKEKKNADEAESSHAEGCREEKSLVSMRKPSVVPFVYQSLYS